MKLTRGEQTYDFFLIDNDPFGNWIVCYWRKDLDNPGEEIRCSRQILDENEKRIRGVDRRPIGRELLSALQWVIGRPLTRAEEESAFGIKMIEGAPRRSAR